MKDILKVALKGYSQVMFQESVFTGLLFLIGILYNSWQAAIGSVIGVAFGMLAAAILDYNKKDILAGRYGFNAVLVGTALVFFFGLNIPVVLMIIAGAVLSSLIMNFMHERNLSPYTFPFVLATWILLLFIKLTGVVSLKVPSLVPATFLDTFSGVSMGFGQVMFQGSIITGIIFFVAILSNSRIAAAYALMGSAIGFLTAYLFSLPLNLINMGIFGFNGVLCGIAFAGRGFRQLAFGITAILLSVGITYWMVLDNIAALTAPFVFATWIVLLMKKKLN
jgi:urea transporter